MAADKVHEFDHVLFGRVGIAVYRHADVVHAEDQVVLGGDRARPLDQIDGPQQGDDMASAGLRHRVMQAGERADVDHLGPSESILI
jgi:hypothetical protein